MAKFAQVTRLIVTLHPIKGGSMTKEPRTQVTHDEKSSVRAKPRTSLRRQARRAPRARLRGGDTLTGAWPTAVGHAGTRSLGLWATGKLKRVGCALLAMLLVMYQVMWPASFALADDSTSESTSGEVTFATYHFPTSVPQSISFTASNGAVAYCLDYEKEAPKAGQGYALSKTATGGLGYIALHGYNNTTYIEGEELSRNEALAATQYAYWIYRGSIDREGVLLKPAYGLAVGETPKLRMRSEKVWQAAVRLADAAVAFENDPTRNTPDAPENTSSQVYVQSDGGSTNQEMMVITVVSGNIALTKDSTDPRTIGNQNSSRASYSLRGAIYKVWRDSDCTIDTQTYLTVDAYGQSKLRKVVDGIERVVSLPLGTYYVREFKAPKGYEVDDTVYKVQVNRDQVSWIMPSGESIHEVPTLRTLSLHKSSSAPSLTSGNSLYSLEGAVYGVWDSRVAANKLEDSELAGDPKKLDGYWFLVQSSSNDNYSLDADTEGTGVTLEHLSAASDQKWQVTQNADGSYSLKNEATNTYLAKGSDGVVATSSSANASSTWRLEERDGGTYAIVSSDGTTLTPQTGYIEPGTKVQATTNAGTGNGQWYLRRASSFQGSLTTDANGNATLDNLLNGTYYVREITAPMGFELDNKTYTVSLNGQSATLETKDSPLVGDVSVVAIKTAASDEVSDSTDADSQESTTTPVALAGAQFTVSYYNGLYSTMDELPAEPTRSWVLNTDTDGKADLSRALTDPDTYLASGDDLYLTSQGKVALPLGTVTIRETKAPEGYIISDGQTYLQQIKQTTDSTGSTVVSAFQPVNVSDEPARGDLTIRKTDGVSGAPLAGIPFLIRSKSTGEAHIIVTDAEGTASTALAPHTQNTNRNDLATRTGLDVNDPTDELDQAVLSANNGVWFYGASGSRTQPTEGRGALPYGEYTVMELKSPANRGYGDSDPLDVTIAADRSIVQKTVINTPVSISTSLTDQQTGLHSATSREETTLVDTVTYDGLTAGQSYTLEATLMDKNTGEVVVSQGKEVTATTDFVAVSSSGTATVEIPFDATELGGKSVVAFEKLIRQGREIASHTDLNDSEQTVTFSQIKTSAKSTATNERQATGSSEEVLEDIVSYGGLVPGAHYTMTTTLHLRGSDGSDLGTATNAEGAPITHVQDFVPEASDGTIACDLTLNTQQYQGATLVFFEELSQDGVVVATHNDISDEAQSVMVPIIATTATDTSTSSHEGSSAGATRIEDVVSYDGLIPGMEYRLVGTLMDATTGEAITLDGKEATAEARFTPEATSGTTSVEFSLPNAGALAGKTVVVFEKLYLDDVEVARHEDLSDANQTVSFPKIATTATNSNGGHDLPAGNSVTFEDEVSYENLTPGQEYQLTGKLMNKETGQPIQNNGADVTAEVTFTPEAASGTQKVSFTVDTTSLEGVSIVVFESLSTNGHLVAHHEDLDDESQTLHVPSLATTLTDKANGSHAAAPSSMTTLNDRVEFSNLVVGTEYQLHGTLMSKQTGEPLKDSSGKVIEAVKTFTPQASNGFVDVSFALDTTNLTDTDLVAFEELYRNGEVVCSHQDIDDESQTVLVQNNNVPNTPDSPTTKTTTPSRHVTKSALPSTGDTLVDACAFIGIIGTVCIVLSKFEFFSSRYKHRR